MATIRYFTTNEVEAMVRRGHIDCTVLYPYYAKESIKIKKILKNGDYTTVLWKDGSHTVVKKMASENDDPEKALLFAMLKKLCDNNGSKMAKFIEDAESKTVIHIKK